MSAVAKNVTARDKLLEIESILGDIESDIEGIKTMDALIGNRPAIAIINDIASLVTEMRDAFDVEGVPLYDMIEETKLPSETKPKTDKEPMLDVNGEPLV